LDLSDFTFEPRLSRASTIPARWYTDPAMLEAERRNVFGRTWQAVGRACDVAAPGSYLAGEVTGEPVLVTRDQDGRCGHFPTSAAIAARFWRKATGRRR
jgi:choline monooxygenase